MLEYNRIITKGIATSNFIIPETICDFYVDEERKKLWLILLDLLVEFDAICRKFNLKYWLSFGGLLGAIRHNGFIPWDDDLDVCMPRADYERLLQLEEQFTYPYYLQIPFKDDGYYYSFAKLRNTNTTAISTAFRYQNFNQGCFLDIFPLDKCNLNDAESNYDEIKRLLITNSTNMKRSNPYPSEADLERYKEYPYESPLAVYNRIEAISQMHNNEQCELCSTSVMTFYNWRKMTWPIDTVEDLIDIDFYGHKISIPRNWDLILKTTYGDYMKFPPISMRGNWHAGTLFDCDNNYIYWLELLRQKDYNKNKL